MWPERRPILVLLILAAAVHTCVLAAAHVRTGGIDGYAFSSLDCGEFYTIARNLAEHGVFSDSELPPLEPDTWRTPGYPLFLAVFIFLGDSPAMLVVVGQVLGVINVLLLFLIARRWMSTRRAFVAACLCLLEPYHLFYSLWLMSTTLFVTVLLLVWLSWQRGLQKSRWPWFLLAGVLSGFLVLVRPVGSLIPVALLLGLLFIALRPRPEGTERPCAKASWRPIVIFAACALLVVGSWMLRNSLVAGHFALSDQGGVVLAYFKAAEVALWREGRAADRYLETTLDPDKTGVPHKVWEDIDARLRSELALLPEDERAALQWQNLAQGNRTTTDPFVVSQMLSRIAWSYLVESPVATATCCVVRCGSILTFPLNLAVRPPTGVEVRRFTAALKGFVYLLFLLWVVVRLFQGRLTFEQCYFPLACTVALLLATTPQIDPRFRVPMIPLLLVVALLPRRVSKRD